MDCSTQSTKVVVCDDETGEVVREGRAPHPDVTEIDPRIWWQAWEKASAGILDDVAAVAVGGQQHGMVLVDEAGTPVRDALLWNDNRSAPQAAGLIEELGGAQAWADRVGSVPVASFTVAKLRWVAEHERASSRRRKGCCSPTTGSPTSCAAAPASPPPTAATPPAPATGRRPPASTTRTCWRRRSAIRSHCPGSRARESRSARPRAGCALAPGTGDNMAAALGLDLEPGDVAVSLGTSGTVFAVADGPSADPSGIVAGFADATGRFLPLVCTLNAARVMGAALRMAGAELDDLDRLALAEDDTQGLVLLPFLDGERTPALPDATGLLHGLTRANATPAHLVRASVEGMLCGLADAISPLEEAGVTPRRIILTGGAARSVAVQRIAAGLFAMPVVVPEPAEYVALGAARQASWTIGAGSEPPTWKRTTTTVEPDDETADYFRRVRESYSAVLSDARPLLTR